MGAGKVLKRVEYRCVFENDTVYQVEQAPGFMPFCKDVRFDSGFRGIPIGDVPEIELTANPHWGCWRGADSSRSARTTRRCSARRGSRQNNGNHPARARSALGRRPPPRPRRGSRPRPESPPRTPAPRSRSAAPPSAVCARDADSHASTHLRQSHARAPACLAGMPPAGVQATSVAALHIAWPAPPAPPPPSSKGVALDHSGASGAYARPPHSVSFSLQVPDGSKCQSIFRLLVKLGA